MPRYEDDITQPKISPSGAEDSGSVRGDSNNPILIEHRVEYQGIVWNIRIIEIADGAGISVQLDEKDSTESGPKRLYLDWHDIINRPEVARMHLMPGATADVSFEQKKHRMELWTHAILTWENMAEDVAKESWDASAVNDLTRHLTIPRPEYIELDTNNKSLSVLFDELGFVRAEEAPHPYRVPWKTLVELAENHTIIHTWLEQKGIDPSIYE